MQKIRILHIVHSFGIGGLEKGIVMLINNSSQDFEHMILCLKETGASKNLLPVNIPIYELKKQSGTSVSFFWRLVRMIRFLSPDVVHTRNWGGVDGILAARLAGCSRIVHGEHGWGMDDPQGQLLRRKMLRRFLSFGIKEITTVSMQIKDWLENIVRVHCPVTQIYNGIDTSLFQDAIENGCLKQELGIPKTSLLVGTVGRLDPIKDQISLIKSFQVVKEKIPNSYLVVVGEGPERAKLEKARSDGVHLLGMRNDVVKILKSLDLFILPSLNEGLSNTLLEAMAAGLPIVATEIGGTPELIKSEYNGILVPVRDYPALIEAQLRYLNDPGLRRQHGKVSLDIVSKKFTVFSMVSAYESVWRRVLS